MPSSSTSPTSPGSAELLEQADRILASHSFANSDLMRNLLRYLAHHTVDHPDHPPKEHAVAVELLGRPQDFDPKLDPAVRVQTSRLRSKLAEYYVSEGANDNVYLEVPKGSYCLVASYRHPPRIIPPPEAEPLPALPRSAGPARWTWAIPAAGALLLVWFVSDRWLNNDPLRQLWRPFLQHGGETLVVYSNPKLVGSTSTALRMFDPAQDQNAQVNPGYTGAG